MAYFTRSHGDSKPTFQSDTLDQSVVSGIPVNIAGPHLEFFTVDLGATAVGQLGTGGAVESVIKTVQQLAVVYIYQLDADKLSVATYPVGAWGTSADGTAGYNIQSAIRALGTVNTYDLSGAAVLGAATSATAGDGSNAGFKLIQA